MDKKTPITIDRYSDIFENIIIHICEDVEFIIRIAKIFLKHDTSVIKEYENIIEAYTKLHNMLSIYNENSVGSKVKKACNSWKQKLIARERKISYNKPAKSKILKFNKK